MTTWSRVSLFDYGWRYRTMGRVVLALNRSWGFILHTVLVVFFLFQQRRQLQAALGFF